VSLEVDVGLRRGRFALDAAFSTGPGITALFGRSGSGKTTLVNAIAGLVRPARGRIVIDGTTVVDVGRGIDLPAHKRRLGYVFQEGRLFPHLNVRQNLLYGQWFTPRAERRAKLGEVVDLLGIAGLLDRRPAHLSGGEKQRVAIGRALLASPRALLMDEPLASLDAARKNEILPYIERLSRELKLPIVYVSHSLEEVARLANTVVLIGEGSVVAVGPVAQVLARLDLRPYTGRFEAGSVLTARVLAHDDEFDLTVLDHPAGRIILPRQASAPGSTLRLRVRARDVSLAVEEPRGLSIRNVLRGQVLAVGEPEGAITEVRLDLSGEPLLARLTRQAVHELRIAPGHEVWALLKTVALDRRDVGAALELDL
jgi:molybdate transport system ATP-binding protein